MAGDWIKLEHATATKPEVGHAAELLGEDRRYILGLLFDYWLWLDSHLDDSRPGVVPNVSRKSLEDTLHCPGFAAVLESIGWAKFDDETRTLYVIHWERHNGKTAKSRALEQKKKAAQRANLSRSCPDVVPDLSRLEKRRVREDRNKSNTLSGSQANTDVAILLLQFLNTKTGRHYRPTAKTLEPIRARLREGATVAECRAVIARKCREWSADDFMRPYLRPATLFNATKFAQYVGEVPPQGEADAAVS